MGYLISVAVMLLVIYIAVNVYQVIRLLIGLIMGMKVSCIRFWFLSMVRIQQRTVWGTNRFVPYIISLLLNKDNKKNQRVLHEIICSSLCFVISLAIVGYLCVEHGLMHIIYDDVLCGVTVAILAFMIRMIMTCVRVTTMDYSLNMLSDRCLSMLLGGADYEQLDISMDEIRSCCEKSSGMDKEKHLELSCYMFLFRKMFCLNDRAGMDECIEAIIRNLPENATLMNCSAFSTVIFYYSYINQNPEMAHQFHERNKKQFDEDSDPNGCRQRAYYLYYACGNEKAAEVIVREGIEALAKAHRYGLLDAEIKLETKLLHDLAEKLEVTY